MNTSMFAEIVKSDNQYSSYFEKNFDVSGTPKETDLEEIFKAPQDRITDIVGYSKYIYRKNGVVMRVVNLYRDFGINGFSLVWNKEDDKIKKIINDYNKRINIEQLMRDCMHEQVLTGNLVCYDRNGQAVDIYPIDRLVVYPLRINGKSIIGYKTDEINEYMESFGEDIDKLLASAYPKEIIDAVSKGQEYARLDDKNTFFEKINSSRYERYGISILFPAFEDISHKTLLKSVEKSISNSIIDKMLLVQIGDAENKPTQKLIDAYAQKFSSIRYGASVVVPHYVNVKFVEPETSGLDANKFIEVDKDILNALGISVSLLRGEGQGSYSDGLVNFTGITKSIENCRKPIANIIHGLYRNELERNGANPDDAPTIKFSEVVIDKSAIASIMNTMFLQAGLPYEMYYEVMGFDYNNIKMMRKKENDENTDVLFSPRQLPYTQSNMNDDNGRPTSNLDERKSDPNQSNNNQVRPNAKKITGNE